MTPYRRYTRWLTKIPYHIAPRMASAQLDQLDDKTEMYELTDKQRVVVNALAEHPDKGPTRIAEIASEALENDTVSRSYVTPIKQKYADLVEQQREIKENKRHEGTERTTGDPFDKLNETLGDTKKAWQTIQERPHKDTTSNGQEEKTLRLDVSRRDVELLLAGDVPEELRRELVVKIVDRAFE